MNRPPPIRAISWEQDRLVLLDQRFLPHRKRHLLCRSGEDVVRAIRALAVRGAPAIGIAAAFGVVLEGLRIREADVGRFLSALERRARKIEAARPTAVNLRWALKRMLNLSRSRPWKHVAELRKALAEEALRIFREDIDTNRRIGRAGSALIRRRACILTYCNTGSLATGGYGTAAGVIRACWEQGKNIEVLACETRPYLQGARLTAWELMQEGIPVTLITDNMAAHFMAQGAVDAVLVGADRVAANGDVANKIGTYGLAVLAKKHRIPFYVAIPVSSLDPACPSGREIPIEYRDPREVTRMAGVEIAPRGCKALYPAFDITPHKLVTAFVTDQGVVGPPYRKTLKKIAGSGQPGQGARREARKSG